MSVPFGPCALTLADFTRCLRETFDGFTDPRRGQNTRYTLADAGLSAFSVFFMQSPSFLKYQRGLESAGGRSNAQTLFGVHRIPSDNWIRTLLDATEAEQLGPLFGELFEGLRQAGVVERYRTLNGTLLLALVVARVIEPGSKLATQRLLHPDTASGSLGRLLGLENVSVEQLYAALDWLAGAQRRIERRLTRQHLSGATARRTVLVLYDPTSTRVTGRCGALAAHGYSRDGKRGEQQIVFGLIGTADGCPLAVEVFAGNTADPSTVAARVAKLKDRYGIERIARVGDRGMLTQARIEQVLRPHGLDWISTLRAPQLRALAEAQGPFQYSLFDARELLELRSEAFPGERLVVYGPPR